ncbi:MAG: Orotate phosphoribosyltransferase [Lentisphaerae bacterium ADurb.Bin242]|nr:MAG: Orotate phosphoribosyltransferase [Lentisphaerae bacterium ADurb.Bin242]
MTDQEIVQSFQKAGALLDGHFILRSGLHSGKFFQAALLFRYPDIAEKLCRTLAERMKHLGAETVISPAVGGILVGQELARALGIQAIFADKENDQLVLKRGFTIRKGEKIIVAEDVVTKGGRVQQTIDLVRSLGGEPVAVGIVTDRSGCTVDFGIPLYSLIQLNLPAYNPADCPLCKAGVPLERPGSKS